jgi:hypothetical protein
MLLLLFLLLSTTKVSAKKQIGYVNKEVKTYCTNYNLPLNAKIKYKKISNDWAEIYYKNHRGCIKLRNISTQPLQIFNVSDCGFKAYEDYRCITIPSSQQYNLLNNYSYTGNYGIRMVNDRYCIAIGQGYGVKVWDKVNLILENGTTIKAIVADLKANQHTDATNMYAFNGSVSEFVVDTYYLSTKAKQMGDISYCDENWQSKIVKVIVIKEDNKCD